MKFIFHYKDKEQEHTFHEGTDTDYVDEAFDDWLFWIGIGVEEADELIESGQAGYYRYD